MIKKMEDSTRLSKADRDRAVAEYQAFIFIEYLHTDLPPGPLDPMDEIRGLVILSPAEFRRRAALGKAMVDAHIAAKQVNLTS